MVFDIFLSAFGLACTVVRGNALIRAFPLGTSTQVSPTSTPLPQCQPAAAASLFTCKSFYENLWPPLFLVNCEGLRAGLGLIPGQA